MQPIVAVLAARKAFKEPRVAVSVSPWVGTMVWLFIAVLHVVCGSYLAIIGTVYCYLRGYALAILDNVELFNIAVNRRYFRWIACGYFATAGLHLYALVAMIHRSVKSRRLLLRAPSSMTITPPRRRHPGIVRLPSQYTVVLLQMADRMLPDSASASRRLVSCLVRWARTIWMSFGITNPNYGVFYTVREMIQTVLQTYQAYRMSYLVTRPWMNNVFVVLLLTSCWATPIIQLLLRLPLGHTRLLCLLVNLTLDLVAYIILPVVLFMPYYNTYDKEKGNFQGTTWYNDLWLMQVVSEWQMLFVTSTWDALSKFVIAFNVTLSLRSIPKLIRIRIRNKTAASQKPVGPATTATSPVSVSAPTESNLVSVTTSTWSSRLQRCGHRLLGLWGVMVFVLHVQTASTRDNPQCMLQVRPWFSNRPACSLMDINCKNSTRTGNVTDFDHAITSINSKWLAFLIIRHCPAVEITPRIQKFGWLLGFKMYNSTLADWPLEAALTNTHHPRVMFAFIISCNMTAIPPGLYHPDFPHQLMDVEFSQVNVTTLPQEIVHAWPRGLFLVIEEFQFPEFPDVLAQVRPAYLSIAMNNFTQIPNAIWENEDLYFLNINGNPVTEIPEKLEIVPPIGWLSLVDTKITRMPTWLSITTMETLIAGDTPFCKLYEDKNASALGISEAELLDWTDYVNCTQAKEFYYLTHYPLPDEPRNSPSSTIQSD